MVAINRVPIDEIELLVKSAKKYFLINHDIHFVLFSDLDVKLSNSDIKVIKIAREDFTYLSYFHLQKILSLNYINLDSYDYVFVHDTDQVYVGPVYDVDLLSNDFCILNHFYKLNAKISVGQFTDVFDIDNRTLEYTMGNFWGGPTHLVKLFLDYTNVIWSLHKNHSYNELGFFSYHADEVVLIKFIDFYRIKERRINCSLDFTKSAYLTSITRTGHVLEHLHNFKLIHDTKVNLPWSNQLYDMSLKLYY